MAIDTISDLLTRIRNAQRAGHDVVDVYPSKMVNTLLKVLQEEGFIASYESAAPGDIGALTKVFLKYFETGEPAISMFNRISKSGRRVYRSVEDIPKVKSGLGISIVSTSQGVMSDREARKRGIGGEVIANVS